ncbi:MAG: DUF448 domain-containing protein, partial [Deinococcus sp.]|nr:DUF448 domain-containing protein [Deinococcus sp.]
MACRRTRPQAELLRLTRTQAGGWHLAQPGARRLPGRGRYLCAENPACWTEKKLRRAFGAAAGALADQLTAQLQATQSQAAQLQATASTPSVQPLSPAMP